MNKLEKTMKKLFKAYCVFCKYTGIFGCGMFAAGILEYGIEFDLVFGIIIAMLVSILPTIYLNKLKKEEKEHYEHW